MVQNLWVTLTVLVLCGALSSCASGPSPEFLRAQALEEKVKIQNEELGILKSQMDEVKLTNELLQKKLVKDTSPLSVETAKLPVEKLKPKTYDGTVPTLPSLFSSLDKTVADSTQEFMHHYYEGLRLLEDSQYDQALKSFQSFLASTPEHVYADRAQFMILETHFRSKDFNLAVVASNLLEARYPYSLKLPEGLYKRALAYSEMDQKRQAKMTLQNFIQRFAGDPLTSEATQKLAQLTQMEAQPSALPMETP